MSTRKPTKAKILAGTDRPDRDTGPSLELPEVEGVPDAPDWLPNHHAVTEWNRVAPILHKLGLLTEPGLTPLAHLCALHGKILQLYQAGALPTGSLIAQYRGLASDFALTPIAQLKVPGNTPSKANTFAGNGKRPRA